MAAPERGKVSQRPPRRLDPPWGEAVVTATRSGAPLWRRLCRSLCREQGAKDAVMVALVAIVLGALALQLGLAQAGPGPAGRQSPAASLRA